MLYEQAPAAYLFDPDLVFGLNPSLKLQPDGAERQLHRGGLLVPRLAVRQ